MSHTLNRLFSVRISNYVREIELSKKQNPKYFIFNGKTIKASGKKLWKRCIRDDKRELVDKRNGNVLIHDLKDTYALGEFKGTKLASILYPDHTTVFNSLTSKQNKLKSKWILIDATTHEKIIANPTQVGTAKMQVISGQHLYDSSIHPVVRAKIVDALKEMYAKKFNTIPPTKLNLVKTVLTDNIPIFILLELQDTIKAWNDKTKEGFGRRWDVSNRTNPYLKTFTDYLVEKGYLEDDDRLNVCGDGSVFTPINIDEGQDRALVFHFYTDKRDTWIDLKI